MENEKAETWEDLMPKIIKMAQHGDEFAIAQLMLLARSADERIAELKEKFGTE